MLADEEGYVAYANRVHLKDQIKYMIISNDHV